MKTITIYTADYCPPCRYMHAHVLPGLRESYPGQITEVDCCTDPQKAVAAGVKHLPTIDLCRDGERIRRLTGRQQADALKEWLGEGHDNSTDYGA